MQRAQMTLDAKLALCLEARFGREGLIGHRWPIFFTAIFETDIGNEHLTKVYRKLLNNFLFWGVTTRQDRSGHYNLGPLKLWFDFNKFYNIVTKRDDKKD